ESLLEISSDQENKASTHKNIAKNFRLLGALHSGDDQESSEQYFRQALFYFQEIPEDHKSRTEISWDIAILQLLLIGYSQEFNDPEFAQLNDVINSIETLSFLYPSTIPE